MKYRELGHPSIKASVLGIGGLHFGVFCDQVATTRIIHSAIDLGINFIDTAPMYGQGHSEAFIKHALEGHRGDVLIGTKVGLEPLIAPDGTFGVSVVPLTNDKIRASLEKSLRALGTDYIDLFQVHAFDPTTPLDETIGTLDALVHEGKVRFIGCSNYSGAELELVSTANRNQGRSPLVSLQAHFNMIERRADHELIPVCRSSGIKLICYRALARGILTGKYKNHQPLPEGSRASTSPRVRRWLSEPTLGLVESLDRFSQSRGHTVTELAVAWLLSMSEVSVVLVGVRNLEHLTVCARGSQWVLSEEDMTEIDDIIAGLGLTAQVDGMPETFLET